MKHSSQHPERFLRMPDVMKLLGLSKPTIYRHMKTIPTFPRPRKIGPRCIGWLESEVVDYMKNLPKATGKPAKGVE